MTLNDLSFAFNRAFKFSFSKKKFLTVFPVLILCGVLIIFCRILGYNSHNWISMSLIFLPIFLSSGILLALGTLLIRYFYHEAKNLKHSYTQIFASSIDLIIGTAYLSVPPILIYLLLWMVLGIFMLLKELPGVGEYMGVILAFAPFLIILSSILLVFLSLAILFFVTPMIALGPQGKVLLAKNLIARIKNDIFNSLLLFFVGLFPIVLSVGFLVLAGFLTSLNYLVSEHFLSLSIRWFIIMIPFCFCLTFATIFFFNFAAESYNLTYKKESA
jgi:hypothetical protein